MKVTHVCSAAHRSRKCTLRFPGIPPQTRAVHTALQQGRLPDSVPEDRRLSARSCCRTGFPISRRRPSMIAIGRPVDSQTALIAVDLGGQERVGAALGQRDHPGLAEGRPVGPGPGELGRVGRGVRQVQLEPVDDQQPQAPQEPSHAPCPARSAPRAGRHPIPGHRPAGPLEQLGKHPTAQPFRPWVIALTVGTDHPAFQQPNRSSDPVTLAATSS